MLQQAADFRADADELHTLLATLADADWDRPTLFKAWTVNDIVLHLHESDLMAAASVAGPEAFGRLRGKVQALRDSGMTRLQAQRELLAGLNGKRLLETWVAGAAALADSLAGMSPNARLTWFGPDMGVRMFTTARQMETWAHGQAIFDLMGATRRASERLRNIAEIGVRTFGWTFANRGLPAPGPAPHVRLTGPWGTVWQWNDPDTGNSVTGSAVDFCQVVTQVRNVADTSLIVAGEPAYAWMTLAQCFAGPPEDPPAPGTRFTAVRP